MHNIPLSDPKAYYSMQECPSMATPSAHVILFALLTAAFAVLGLWFHALITFVCVVVSITWLRDLRQMYRVLHRVDASASAPHDRLYESAPHPSSMTHDE